MVLTNKQRGVVAGISMAAIITVLALFGGIWLSPEALTPIDSLESRLAFVARWDLLVIFWLVISVGALARYRFFSPDDIDGSGLTTGTAKARIYQSVLQNTLEQVVLAVAVHAACAVVLPIQWMVVLPVAAVLFTIGRALFWRGYHGGASARALGFGLTFYPTVLLFLLLLVRVVLPH